MMLSNMKCLDPIDSHLLSDKRIQGVETFGREFRVIVNTDVTKVAPL